MLAAAMSPRSELEDDHALLCRAVRDAGALAMSYFGNAESWEKRPGHPVSDADIAVNELLMAALRGARPDYAWLSEEDRDSDARLSAARLWVVDPIDGTRAFLRGRHEFSVTAGLLDGGAPVAGVVYSPSTDEFYDAIKGGGARLNGQPVRVAAPDRVADSTLLVSRSEMQKKHWREVFADCDVRPISSVAFKLARVAAGQADATISLWPKSDWDIVAGDLLVEEAGGRLSRPDGTAMRYNQPTPRHPGLVAASATLSGLLLKRLQRL